jgi:hypothetical protein
MTDSITTAEALARRFHETYERLAPKYGYETREASAKPWEQVPKNNRQLMIAVCAEVGAELLVEAEQLHAQAIAHKSVADRLRQELNTQKDIIKASNERERAVAAEIQRNEERRVQRVTELTRQRDEARDERDQLSGKLVELWMRRTTKKGWWPWRRSTQR